MKYSFKQKEVCVEKPILLKNKLLNVILNNKKIEMNFKYSNKTIKQEIKKQKAKNVLYL